MVSRIVLIVDDEPEICETFAEVVEDAGFEPATAHSAQEAIKKLDELDVGLVFSDFWMPETSGLVLCNEAKSRRPELPVVIITAYGKFLPAGVEANYGPDEILEKPVAPGVIEAVLKKHEAALRQSA